MRSTPQERDIATSRCRWRSCRCGLRLLRVEVNGQPGAKLLDREERIVGVLSLDVAEGTVHCVRSVVNPEKLKHLGPVSDYLAWPGSGG
jgi:RNA polymerase sigma-70 factor (ECF subfamily)